VSDDDRFNSAVVAILATAAQALLDMALAQGINLIIYHRDTNSFNNVTSWVIENIVDNQRRRLPARGR
jgi:hypothetical protein